MISHFTGVLIQRDRNFIVDDLKYWKRNERESDKSNPWSKVPNSINIEMTSYALLSYIKRRMYEDAMPILRWLITQQNNQGGFASTQVRMNVERPPRVPDIIRRINVKSFVISHRIQSLAYTLSLN